MACPQSILAFIKLKLLTQAKIIIFILAPVLFLYFQNVHLLELLKPFKFWVAYLPVNR